MRGSARGLLGGGLVLLFAASALALSPTEISAMRQSRRQGVAAAQPPVAMARRTPRARRSEGEERPQSRQSEEEDDQALQAAVNRAKLDTEFRRTAARTMGGEDVFQRVPGMKVSAHRARPAPPSDQEAEQQAQQEAEQQAKEEAEEQAEAAFLKRESPMSETLKLSTPNP